MSAFRPAHLSKALEDLTRDCFAVIDHRVESVPLRGLGGFDQDAVIEFSDGLNIVHSLSGGGKSRFLKHIAINENDCLALNPRDVSGQSFQSIIKGKTIGLCVLEICRMILDISPDDGCILMDDVLDFFDPVNTVEFLGSGAGSGKHVILAANSHSVGRIEEILQGVYIFY